MPGTFSPGGGRAPVDVINKYSESASKEAMVQSSLYVINTGVLTADVYSTVLEITSGPGVISALAVSSLDGTARTLTPRVTIDGVEVFEQISSVLGANEGVLIFGSNNNGEVLETASIQWKSSLKIEIDSSLSETDKSAIWISYILT